MSIGLCCQYIEKNVSTRGKVTYKNIFEERTLHYSKFCESKYSQDQITEIWVHNISKVKELLPKVYSEGIKSFRLSSGYFPLHDSLKSELQSNEQIKLILKDIGDYAIQNNIRLTAHPDQFVVLSSESSKVVDTSKRMLDHHAWMMDCMGLPQTPYYSINIHGGVRGKSDSLIKETNTLPPNVKNRLTFENDERCYNVLDLYKVYQETGVPICFDSHHHTFNDANLSVEEALQKSVSTWGNYKPMTHLSNTEPELVNGSFTDRRKHSEYVYYIPEYQKILNNEDKIDIEFEFKMKQLAIFKAVEELEIKL